jgi:hypothetical protein
LGTAQGIRKGVKYVSRPAGFYGQYTTTSDKQKPLIDLDIFAFLTKISVARKVAGNRGKLLVHGLKKFFVVLGSMHLILQELHRVDYAELR